MDTPPPDQAGDSQEKFRFGHFLVEKVLGQGTFATVYQAILVGEFGIQKPVALKVLRRRVTSFEDKATAGLINEARLGARMRHPNLVEFYECGQVGNRIYISMELIEGPNLAQVRTTAKELPYAVDQSLVVSIALQSARGLGAMHRATLDGARIEAIHQDMKPGNILLTREGQAKITDFGISRFATDFYMTLGIEGPRGSPLYMSPEQSRGVELTQASDVFSWGTTILELVVGKPVFAAPSLEEILQKVQSADARDAFEIARKRVPELCGVLEQCLQADPSRRIQDGAALVEELRKVTPPLYGDEAIARLAKDIFGILSERMSQIAGHAVQHLLRGSDDDDPGDPGNLVDTDLGEGTPDDLLSMDGTQRWTREDDSGEQTILFPDEEPSEDGAPPSDPAREAFERLEQPGETGDNRGAWIAVVVFVVVLVAGLGVAAVLLPWGELLGGTEVGEVTETETVTEAETEAVSEAVSEAESEIETEAESEIETEIETEPPTEAVVEPPTQAVVEPPTEPDPPTEAPIEPDTPTLHLTHTPVSRGILGKDVLLSLQVSPPDAYRATVHYRAIPGGSWQTKTSYGGDSGTIRLTIPAGSWQAQDSLSVEYWIQVRGNDLEGTSGSAGSPHSYRLY